MEKVVALVIAFHGFQPVEYADTKNELERAQIRVVTVSNKPGVATASDNCLKVPVDVTIEQLQPSQYAALVCVGGPGALDALDTTLLREKLFEAAKAGRVVAAICIAPRILARAGILKGKRATGWDGDGQLSTVFNEFKVNQGKNPVIVDGAVVTADGPQAAQAFGKAVADAVLSAL